MTKSMFMAIVFTLNPVWLVYCLPTLPVLPKEIVEATAQLDNDKSYNELENFITTADQESLIALELLLENSAFGIAVNDDKRDVRSNLTKLLLVSSFISFNWVGRYLLDLGAHRPWVIFSFIFGNLELVGSSWIVAEYQHYVKSYAKQQERSKLLRYAIRMIMNTNLTETIRGA